jgi:dTDP-glucose 4,6-dehydratase
MRDSPILVTGGAGFIGSALVRHLVRDRGERVVTLDALTYAGSLASLEDVLDHPAHAFERADIADPDAVADVLARHRPRAVLHLAAESHVDRSIDGPAAFVRTNLLGTFTMLEESLGYWRALDRSERDSFRFVHVSTDEVYGALGATGHFTAASAHRPNSPYAASKSGADQLARAWHRTYGFPVVTTNCCNNYGPYQYPEKLIPLVIRRAAAEKAIPVYGAGDQVRDWLHVDDHVAALLAALERGVPGETYVIGADCERRTIDLVHAICAEVDALRPSHLGPRASRIVHVADRPGHDFRYAIDASATRAALDWSPRVSFERGLAETVRWYLEHEPWCGDVIAGRYDGERLGLAGAAR